MDIVLVGGIELIHDTVMPQIGPLIIYNKLSKSFSTKLLDFDYMTYSGVIQADDDYERNVDLYAEHIMQYRPNVVGFYTMCNSFDFVIRISSKIKTMDNKIKIFFGGPHATINAYECLDKFDFVDAILLGESEKNIVRFAECLLNNDPLHKIKGIAFKDLDEIIFTESESLLTAKELEDTMILDYHFYNLKPNDSITIEGGRGCPYSCTFCSTSIFWGKKYRVINASKLVDQIELLQKKYRINNFSIVHDHFTANSIYIKSFCEELLSREINANWNCSARVNDLSDDILRLMKKSGCNHIYIGIESGSEKIQQSINKNIDLRKAIQKVAFIKSLKIDVTASSIYGFPDETIEDFLKTLNFIEQLYLLNVSNIQIHPFKIYSKTIESEKVMNAIYFDRDDIIYSLHEDKYFDEITGNLIERFPSLFLSYYTFDNEVRSKFPMFHTFIYIISVGINVFNHSLKYIIKHKGLNAIYEDFKDYITELHLNRSKFGEKSNIDNNYGFIEFTEKYIKNTICDVNDEVFAKIFIFEKSICEFIVNGRDKQIITLRYNISDLILKNEDNNLETSYFMSKINNRIKISTIVPNFKHLLNNYESRI